MEKILIVGGGYAGFYTAWGLEKKLRRGEADVTLVDPHGYMTYQPFLPEVTAGSIEARHVMVSLRRHLRRTTVIAGHTTKIDHAHRTATVHTNDGALREIAYDTIVVTAGAVTRTFPVPGIEQEAIGLKHVEEAVAIRDALLTAFDRAALLPPGIERRRLLTVTVVGGGFTGVEVFGELLSLATALLRSYPELGRDDLAFHLVDSNKRILPEVTDEPGRWVVRHLQERGGRIHLGTQVVSAADGRIMLSTGESYGNGLLIWAAGNGSNPVVAKNTDLPVDERGLIRARADLRVGTDEAPVPDAWAAGDNAAVPDLASPVPGARTVPNAQHAVRQGKLLAKNLVADLRGRKVKPYLHHSLGVVATLGIGRGIFQYKRLVIKGFPAWIMHRGYHVLAVPTWERKVRVLLVWLSAVLFGRDIIPLSTVQAPRAAFLAGGDPFAGSGSGSGTGPTTAKAAPAPAAAATAALADAEAPAARPELSVVRDAG
ncbi:FAD-dependent oxidoreductase [Promicromonospora sukumoe]|uniref:NADH dehydrogenase n=1 Tax=Promicromonospora sukumoe TaxID=88382 RepID=A0A7W3J8H3_9MICO|nr:FAD-dependent oxidoreductase [Promicromonospora sukumoe]MBA8808237.1 NADH dehydrogenase [Promicromonospora sukumoe]